MEVYKYEYHVRKYISLFERMCSLILSFHLTFSYLDFSQGLYFSFVLLHMPLDVLPVYSVRAGLAIMLALPMHVKCLPPTSLPALVSAGWDVGGKHCAMRWSWCGAGRVALGTCGSGDDFRSNMWGNVLGATCLWFEHKTSD